MHHITITQSVVDVSAGLEFDGVFAIGESAEFAAAAACGAVPPGVVILVELLEESQACFTFEEHQYPLFVHGVVHVYLVAMVVEQCFVEYRLSRGVEQLDLRTKAPTPTASVLFVYAVTSHS